MKKRKILIIYTGGTIGMEKDYDTGSLRPFNFQNIFNKIPEMSLLDCDIDVVQFEKPLDSSDVGVNEWRNMVKIVGDKYDKYDGFVILHGTDTMAYTASAVSFMLRGLRKPVILTGSQLPIGDLRTDAKENLLTSLYYASLYENNEAVVQEVALYFEYKLLRGNRCIKYSAEFFDAFHSPNYPFLGQSGVHLNIDKNVLFRTEEDNFEIDLHLSDEVLLIRIFPGMKFETLNLLQDTKVIILQVFGSGTIFSNPKTLETLDNLKKKGTEIVVISQCLSGSITIGKYQNSNIFTRIGAINGKDITAEGALAKAMHIYNNPKYDGESFSEVFSKNLRGEFSETL